MDIYKNDRFYKIVDDVLQEFRITRINNENSFTVEITKGDAVGDSMKITRDTIKQLGYIKLNPDAIIEFMIVEVTDKLQDVMVTITKKNTNTPYVVCRQSSNDIFAQMVDPTQSYYGVCISRDTCPNGVNFDDFLFYTKIKKSEKVSYYIGDTLIHILKFLRFEKEYNDTLLDLFKSHAMYVAKNNKYIAKVYENRRDIDGYYKTITDLLSFNNFEHELYSSFSIIATTFDEDEIEGGILSEKVRKALSDIMNVSIDKSLVVEYDKDVDLDSIKRKYVLISLSNKKVYIVAYTIMPQPANPIVVTNKDGSINIADSMRTFDCIAFNREKYNK